jgi:hypothetical protein
MEINERSGLISGISDLENFRWLVETQAMAEDPACWSGATSVRKIEFGELIRLRINFYSSNNCLLRAFMLLRGVVQMVFFRTVVVRDQPRQEKI